MIDSNLNHALVAAIAALSGAIVVLFGIVRANQKRLEHKIDECERDRKFLHQKLSEVLLEFVRLQPRTNTKDHE